MPSISNLFANDTADKWRVVPVRCPNGFHWAVSNARGEIAGRYVREDTAKHRAKVLNRFTVIS